MTVARVFWSVSFMRMRICVMAYVSWGACLSIWMALSGSVRHRSCICCIASSNCIGGIVATVCEMASCAVRCGPRFCPSGSAGALP